METRPCGRPNGLEMSRPASAHIVSGIRFAAAGRVGSIELLARREKVDSAKERVEKNREPEENLTDYEVVKDRVALSERECAAAHGVKDLLRS